MVYEQTPVAAELGPQPASARLDPLSRLTLPRAQVFERLCEYPDGTTVAALAEACRQHPNTLREHLDALVRAELATRTTAPSHGRGRPAIIYRADPLRASRPYDREYSHMVGVFAAHIEATEPDVGAWARASGERYGRTLVRDPEPGAEAGIASVRAVLDHHHFDPYDAPDGTIRLRQCPRLDLAREHRELICSQHQGELAGIFAAHGVEAARIMRLTPFALPGSCLIEVLPDPDAGPPVPPERPASRHPRSAATPA